MFGPKIEGDADFQEASKSSKSIGSILSPPCVGLFAPLAEEDACGDSILATRGVVYRKARGSSMGIFLEDVGLSKKWHDDVPKHGNLSDFLWKIMNQC